jgi:ubiquinone biosynthesis protein COQ4
MSNQMTDVSKLSAPQRWRRAIRALANVFADPGRTDEVLAFSTYANAGTMASRLHRFYDDANGRKLYAERRTIDSHTVDLDALAALPEGTLGHAYAHFLRSRGFTPDVFEGTPEAITDPKAAYVIQRVRQTHDLWHVVTGHDTDPASEVALQAFTYAQLHSPSSLILAALGVLRGTRQKPTLARDVVRSFRAGRHAEAFATFLWEDHWTTPLAEVRAMLGVEPVTAAA